MNKGIDSLRSNSKIYFIGIGGISMSGLARLAQGYGFVVAGSDMHISERTKELESKGIKVYGQQAASNILDFKPDYIVKTAAILPHNSEVIEAIAQGIQIFDRAEFLGLLTESYERVINISGTHGKTTVTAMTSMMLIDSDKDPTVHLGAELDYFKGTIRFGHNRNLLISEACEFNRSFLHFSSTTAAITNIDHDHVDCYPKLSDVVEVFAKFLDNVSDNGYVVVNGACQNTANALEIAKVAREILGRPMPNIITCNREEGGTFCAKNIGFVDGKPSYDIYYMDELIGHVNLRIPGLHNVDNSLIATACAFLNGASPEAIVKALNEFNGADGRFTIKGKYRDCLVVADYAHHPAAARATIEAASHIPHREIIVVFQPLTFNRTKMLFEDYVTSLLPCKKVLFAEIFSDREVNTHEISSKDISDEINNRGGDAEFFESKADLHKRLDEIIQPNDIILILGPEDIREFGDCLCPKV